MTASNAARQVTRIPFPSAAWFQTLSDRMAAQPAKYRRMGSIDVTLVPRIVMPSLEFEGYACRRVGAPAGIADVEGAHAVILEGDLAAWREMIESIEQHGGADLSHTLNTLTLPDWPLRFFAANDGEGQIAVDRAYRFMDSLQEFFNEASAIETEFDS
jgi:hypothetical protein